MPYILMADTSGVPKLRAGFSTLFFSGGDLYIADDTGACRRVLLDSENQYIQCEFCGRVWPIEKTHCWDGKVGCGGALLRPTS